MMQLFLAYFQIKDILSREAAAIAAKDLLFKALQLQKFKQPLHLQTRYHNALQQLSSIFNIMKTDVPEKPTQKKQIKITDSSN